MCGLFGFIADRTTNFPPGPDIQRLREIAVQTESRGTDAFGLAWIDALGLTHVWKAAGPASKHLDAIEQTAGAKAVIGHCRWATHGTPRDNRNNHPHRAGHSWFVHNGVVHNLEALTDRFGLRFRTQCDTEAIGLMIARRPGNTDARVAWALNHAEGDQTVLVLSPAGALTVGRRGRPLHWARTNLGLYLASEPYALPYATCHQTSVVPDYTVRTVVQTPAGTLRLVRPPTHLACGPMELALVAHTYTLVAHTYTRADRD
jgi:glucosamine 6-phosphate synthetase-like amidotransferase/phosphosugar isomerase protein